VSLITGVFIFVLFVAYQAVFRSLVIDSNLSFNLNNIFHLEPFTLVGLVVVALLLFSFLSASLMVSRRYLHHNKAFVFIGVLLLSFVISIPVCTWLDLSIGYLLFPLIILALSYFLSASGRETFSLTFLFISLLLFSVFNTFFLNDINQYKENENRKLLAIKLSEQRDPTLEYLFEELSSELSTDTVIIGYLSASKIVEDKIVERIDQLYLDDYWLKYDHQITICRPEDELLINPNNISVNCETFFGNTMKELGIETPSENLLFLDDGSGNNNYLGVLPYMIKGDDPDSRVTIFIEFFSKYAPKDLGYPKLLIDQQTSMEYKDLSDYSYARYSKEKLKLQIGKFFFPINQKITASKKDFIFYEDEGFDHLLYKIDQDNQLVISMKSEGFLELIAPFSYLVITFTICFVLMALLSGYFRSLNQPFTFRSRIQVSLISIILVSFIVIGLASYSYILTLNSNKNQDQLGEKAHSILIEVEHKLSDVEEITPDLHQYITGLLIKFSNVFFSDINLYDLEGNLIATSRPKIFEEGLLSRKMNATAFNELSHIKKTQYIHSERIGELEYLSTYVPFRNSKNEVIAYLNLPYFAKQGELKSEISNFITAFINIYLILIALAVLLAILVSGYITLPLNLIKQKIGQFSLSKRNERIDWKQNDEIGSLIEEYNRMVDELEFSALQLAKSEREGAWREMAKQVAHEIKNPLTPMKLSIQNLERAWNDKADDWDERLNRFTKTAIEQIDTLSEIASEFSNFAQLPEHVSLESVDMTALLVASTELFNDSTNIDFTYSFNSQTAVQMKVDRTQITRVFNNLIKNAVQALDDQESGKIDIALEEKTDLILVKISDNGPGISEDQIDKIFSPKFTTKSSGTGLGLAMTKTIVENHQGNVWFESKENVGTTFYISIPKLS